MREVACRKLQHNIDHLHRLRPASIQSGPTVRNAVSSPCSWRVTTPAHGHAFRRLRQDTLRASQKAQPGGSCRVRRALAGDGCAGDPTWEHQRPVASSGPGRWVYRRGAARAAQAEGAPIHRRPVGFTLGDRPTRPPRLTTGPPRWGVRRCSDATRGGCRTGQQVCRPVCGTQGRGCRGATWRVLEGGRCGPCGRSASGPHRRWELSR